MNKNDTHKYNDAAKTIPLLRDFEADSNFSFNSSFPMTFEASANYFSSSSSLLKHLIIEPLPIDEILYLENIGHLANLSEISSLTPGHSHLHHLWFELPHIFSLIYYSCKYLIYGDLTILVDIKDLLSNFFHLVEIFL